MLLRVNSSGARMSCEGSEQTPKGRDGAKPANQFNPPAGRRFFSEDAPFALSSRRSRKVLTRAKGIFALQTRNRVFAGLRRINACFCRCGEKAVLSPLPCRPNRPFPDLRLARRCRNRNACMNCAETANARRVSYAARKSKDRGRARINFYYLSSVGVRIILRKNGVPFAGYPANIARG